MLWLVQILRLSSMSQRPTDLHGPMCRYQTCLVRLQTPVDVIETEQRRRQEIRMAFL